VSDGVRSEKKKRIKYSKLKKERVEFEFCIPSFLRENEAETGPCSYRETREKD
jgi:hypothetical protein